MKYHITLNFWGKKLLWFSWLWMESRKIFHEYLVTQGKNEEIFPTSRKFLSRNIYFGTEFKESRKVFCHESLELYGICWASFISVCFSQSLSFYPDIATYITTYLQNISYFTFKPMFPEVLFVTTYSVFQNQVTWIYKIDLATHTAN